MGITRPRYSNIVDGDFKNSCRLATTSNITLEGGAPLTYDGVTLVNGDRVLVTNQNNGYENGIYMVLTAGSGTNGTWRRSFDANSNDRLNAGAQTAVSEGTFGGSIYRLITPDPIVIGVTTQVWVSGVVAAGGGNQEINYNNYGTLSGTANLLFNTSSTNLVLRTSTLSENTTTGAFVVKGGIGVGNGLYVDGVTYLQNISTPNIRVTGGSITGVSSAFTTLQVDNFSSANIYQSAADTFVTTNFSTGNAQITGGSITGGTGAFTTLEVGNFSSANIYHSAADTFVATNLSSSNVYQTTGQSLQSPNVQVGANWGTLSRANLAVANISIGFNATSANVTTLSAINFSSGNIYQSAADYLVVTNFSSGNIQVVGGSLTNVTGAYSTLQATNFSTGNAQIVGGSLTNVTGAYTKLVATDFSSSNIYQTGTSQSIQTANAQIGNNWGSTSRANLVAANITAASVTNANVTTLVATNFSSANIYQSAADTFVTTNFSTGNAQITGGSLTNVTGAYTKLVATDFSSGNIQITGGSLTNVTGAFTTLEVNNFSSGNIYQSSAGTFVVTNFSSGNIYQSSAGTLVVTNLSTGNLYQSHAGTLVSDNFSSANARIASGYADNFPIGANTTAPGSFTTLKAYNDSFVYANLTVTGNLILTGNATSVVSQNMTVNDSIIDLHTDAALTPLTVDDGKDIGLKYHYFKNGADGVAFSGWANDSGYFEYYDSGTEGVGNVFIGATYGKIKSGSAWFSNATPATSTTQAALRVSGGAGIADGLYVNGTTYLQNYSSPNARVTGGSITGTTGAFTYQVVTNFSSGNIYQSAADIFVATNLSSSNIYQTTGQSLQSPNVQIGTDWGTLSRANLVVGNIRSLNATEGNITTLSAPNFSSSNIYQTGTGQSIQTANAQIGTDWGNTSRANLAIANVRILNATTGNVTTLSAPNFSSSNTFITGGAIGMGVGGVVSAIANIYVQGIGNFGSVSTGNLLATGGSVTGTTGYFTTLRVDNLNTGNLYHSAADYLVSTNFSSGNIYQSAADFFVATNLSSSNAFVTGGAIGMTTGGVTSPVANVYAGMGVITNFGSPNVAITGGYITASGTVQPNANGTVSLGGTSSYWNNLYAVTAYHNTVTVGAGGVTTTDGNLTATSAITGTGNVVITGNIYQGGVFKHAIQYTPAASPHANPQVGDQWYDTVNDTLYEYTDDGTNRFWLDMTGKAVPVTYTAASTAPSAPKAGDQWYDTTTNVLYTRISDGTNSYWVDYSSQAPANTINSSTTIIQPAYGGTGLTTLPNGILKGNGTNPVTLALPGVDYFAIASNGAAVNSTFAAVDINVEDTITTTTVNARNLNFTQYLQGPGATFDALTINQGNIIAGNINLNYDVNVQGNINANNLVSGINLVYTGNISYDGNLNVADVFATNLRLGQWPGVTYIDGTHTLATYANLDTVDFSSFSGSIMLTCATTGITVMYMCGGHSATPIGASKMGVAFGSIAYNAAIDGYTWTNDSGGSLDVSFVATKTLNSA